MRKCNVLLPLMCRSTEALTNPIKERLEKEEWCEIQTIQLIPSNFEQSYQTSKDYLDKQLNIFHEINWISDLIFLVGDRVEAMSAAMVAFLNGVPIVHYGGGITNFIATFDDIFRHNIALLADIELCEDLWSYSVVYDLYRTIKRKNYNIHIVGNLYLDDMEIDESLVPKEKFDLVLINMETIWLSERDIDIQNYENYKKAIDNVKEKYVVYVGGNPDGQFGGSYITNNSSLFYYENLSRSQFLGLLSKCKRFISNSSATSYEAPLFLKPENIIHVGSRNRNRSTNFEAMQKYPSCADTIIKILKEYWLNKQKGE